MGQTLNLAIERKGKKVRAPTWRGWMKKAGAINKGWKDRFFCLEDGRLYYFKSDHSKYSRGYIPMKDATGICALPALPPAAISGNCFSSHQVLLITNERVFMLSVPENDTSVSLIQTLSTNLQLVDQVDMIAEDWMLIQVLKPGMRNVFSKSKKVENKCSDESDVKRQYGVYIGCGELILFTDGGRSELANRIRIIEIEKIIGCDDKHGEQMNDSDDEDALFYSEKNNQVPSHNVRHKSSNGFPTDRLKLRLSFYDKKEDIVLKFDNVEQYEKWKLLLVSAVEDHDLRGLAFLRKQKKEKKRRMRKRGVRASKISSSARRRSKKVKNQDKSISSSETFKKSEVPSPSSTVNFTEDEMISVMEESFETDSQHSSESSLSLYHEANRALMHEFDDIPEERLGAINSEKENGQRKHISQPGRLSHDDIPSMNNQVEEFSVEVSSQSVSRTTANQDSVRKGCKVGKSGKILEPLFTPPSSPNNSDNQLCASSCFETLEADSNEEAFVPFDNSNLLYRGLSISSISTGVSLAESDWSFDEERESKLRRDGRLKMFTELLGKPHGSESRSLSRSSSNSSLLGTGSTGKKSREKNKSNTSIELSTFSNSEVSPSLRNAQPPPPPPLPTSPQNSRRNKKKRKNRRKKKEGKNIRQSFLAFQERIDYIQIEGDWYTMEKPGGRKVRHWIHKSQFSL